MWQEAKTFSQSAGQNDLSDLSAQQARWLKECKDWRGASELYLSMGEAMEAARIVVEANESGWQDVLIQLVRQAPVEERTALMYCGEAFSAGS